MLDTHHQAETICEQPADHLLKPGLCLAVLRTRGDGVGGSFGFDIVAVADGPAWKRVETRRRVGWHAVRVTQKTDHRDRMRNQVPVRQDLYAPVPRVGRTSRF